MLDDARLRRLAEMGIDVYVPRAMLAGAPPTKGKPLARVALVARTDDTSAKALLAQTRRALAFACIDGVIEDAIGVGNLVGAAGLVVFGKGLAREVGAALPADRAKSVQWISAADVESIVGNAAAKRALWSELRRMIRVLHKRNGEGG